jgi:hypothetical protein
MACPGGQLLQLADQLGKTAYGRYLAGLIEELPYA